MGINILFKLVDPIKHLVLRYGKSDEWIWQAKTDITLSSKSTEIMRMNESLEVDVHRAGIRQSPVFTCLQGLAPTLTVTSVNLRMKMGVWKWQNYYISDTIEAFFPIFTENLYPTFLPPIKNLRWQTINQEHKMLQSQYDDLQLQWSTLWGVPY